MTKILRRNVMKNKAFTLIELLVVITIIALLMSILMPTHSHANRLAIRLVCGANLKGLGNACVVYAHDNEGDHPRAGREGATWSPNGALLSWHGGIHFQENAAFGFTLDNNGQIDMPGQATITSSWYLLVKYTKVTPYSFICKSDRDAEVFKLKRYAPPFSVPPDSHRITLQDVFDFGLGGFHRQTMEPIPWPGQVVSYAYHMPYSNPPAGQSFAISETFGSDCPIAADRNPYLDNNAELNDIDQTAANSANHQESGQNLLRKNGSVSFEKNPQIGIGRDNIYTYGGDPQQNTGDPEGTPPTKNGNGAPICQNDAYLVLEQNYR
jgi:prepilin-type N-terminal cleavage/methylation domain-containing protein